MKRWIRNLRFITPVLLVLGGTVLLSGDSFLGSSFPNKPQQVSALTTTPVVVKPAPVKVAIQGVPVRIIIPSVGIDLPVDKGYYNKTKQTWTLSGTHADYATITPPANNTIGGNTFIYGHNNRLVFSKLPQIKTGDLVILKTDNGHTFYYSYRNATDVKPDDTSLFQYQGQPPILTVQTCSGAWYQNRRLFVFDLLRAE